MVDRNIKLPSFLPTMSEYFTCKSPKYITSRYAKSCICSGTTNFKLLCHIWRYMTWGISKELRKAYSTIVTSQCIVILPSFANPYSWYILSSSLKIIVLSDEYICEGKVHGFGVASIMRLTDRGQDHELGTCIGGYQYSDLIFLDHCLVHRHGKDSGLVVGQSDIYYSTSCWIGQRHSSALRRSSICCSVLYQLIWR